jgi:hypothetical protein
MATSSRGVGNVSESLLSGGDRPAASDVMSDYNTRVKLTDGDRFSFTSYSNVKTGSGNCTVSVSA